MTGTAGVPFGPGLIIIRECRRLWRRPSLLGLTVALPLMLMAILSGVFQAGLATRLPIVVLDLDGSSLSRTVTRMVDAAPEAAVVAPVADLAQGRAAILSGRAFGLLMLPRDLQRDLLAGRRPEVVFFYNTQMMTTGNLILRGVSAAIGTAAAGVRLSLRQAQGENADAALADLAPIPVDTHPLFNPTSSYIPFLLAALLPTVLQITIVTATAHVVGGEVASRRRHRVFARLGGGAGQALAAKLVPYTVLFLLVLAVSDLWLFGWLDMPLSGSRLILVASAIAYVLACQALGAVLALLIRPASSAVSIATLLMAPAFSFMGVTFPALAMNDFARTWGRMIPGTWYLEARIDQTIRATPIDLSLTPPLTLVGFIVVLGGLATVLIHRGQTPARTGART